MPLAVDTINALEKGNAIERETLEKLQEGAMTLLDGLITETYKRGAALQELKTTGREATPANESKRLLLKNGFRKLMNSFRITEKSQKLRNEAANEENNLQHDSRMQDIADLTEDIVQICAAITEVLERLGKERGSGLGVVMQEALDKVCFISIEVEQNLKAVKEKEYIHWEKRQLRINGNKSFDNMELGTHRECLDTLAGIENIRLRWG
ncbi:hypothetical protein P171DRAFT_520909 [Karstenula rhodostoma CBS 690.94]|uniref:Uncharacterized protein n=1 Tax=Karstenula rhodostoma CBS 690.94 TaxID=1392251 RepID=A0A9P4PL27_9PLEO|nr:hypothetical protein P171DRAFT_520909 [Karstenula rhodostoma CBS 690.94]